MKSELVVPSVARARRALLARWSWAWLRVMPLASFACGETVVDPRLAQPDTVVASPPAPTVAALELSPSVISLEEAAWMPVFVTRRDANGNAIAGNSPVTWSSSNPAVATVRGNGLTYIYSGKGLVTGITPGTVIITAATAGKSTTATVVVTPAVGGIHNLAISIAGSGFGSVYAAAAHNGEGGVIIQCRLKREVVSGTCTADVTGGTVVYLSKSTSFGTALVGWSGDCTGTADTCTITMTSSRAATVTLRPQVQVLTSYLGSQNITTTGATLAGRVSPAPDSVWFEFDINSKLDKFLTQRATSSYSCTDSSGCIWSAQLNSLLSGTAYFFRIAASDSTGTARGEIQAFTTR